MSKSQIKAMVAIFVASLLCQSVNAISLIMQGVVQEYPGTATTTAQLIISVANLLGIVSMLIVGKAVCFTAKKNVLLVFMGLLAAGALVGYFATRDLAMVFVACGIVGFAAGGLIPLGSALISEHFDGAVRATVMGMQSIFVNGGGMLIQLAGGFLAAIYWKNLFLVYLASIVIAVVVALLLPKGSIEAPAGKGEKVKLFTPFLGTMMLQGFIVGLAMMAFMANITFYVFDLGVGDESSAGLITMAFSGGAVLFGVLIAKIMKLLGRNVFGVALAFSAVALWMFALTSDFTLFVVAGVLAGAGFTMHNTPYYTLAPANCNPAAMTMTISLYTIAMQGGMIVCPIVLTPLAGILGGSLSASFMVGAAITSVGAVIAFITPRLLKDAKLTL